MNITVKTLEGAWTIPGLEASTTVSQLLEIVQQRLEKTALASAPLRLVHKGLRVPEGTLRAAGIEEGDSLVALAVRQWLDNGTAEKGKAPDKATIVEVTTEEARSRGTLDSAATAAAAAADEAATAAARRRRGPRGQMQAMEAQILDMLEQAAPGFVAGHMSAEMSGDEGEGEGEVEEVPLQVPEPNAEFLAQLGDMGFSEGLSKRALLLSRNRFEAAVEYCLTRGDDAHANDPPTEAQLRRIYGRAPAARARFNMQQPEPDAAHVQQLTDMGFPPDQSAAALRRFHNNVEVACQWLLSSGAAFASGGAQDQSAPQQPGEVQAEGAAQQHEVLEEGMDDADGSVSSMDALEGEDGFLGEDSEGEGDSSEGDEHDHDDDEDDEDGDDGSDGDEHEMPLPAEDDYEDGLQDMDGDMAMGEMEYMEDFGGIDIHDLLSRVDDPHFLAEMSNSPQMIDAVQLLLQDPQSYAPLVEHPELAPVMRALRRMVGMEDSSPAEGQERALQQAPQAAPEAAPNPASEGQPEEPSQSADISQP